MPEEPAYAASLNARDLAVARGGRVIVENVSLDLGPGEAIILRGPNGAGKTTLLRALAGLLAPAAGSVAVSAEDSRVFCGALNASKAAMTVDENLRFWAALYGADENHVSGARTAFGLDDYAARPAGHLSTGYARRLGLCRLLIADRPLWFVDEPTAGLDAASVKTFEAILSAHRDNGGAAVVATHEPIDIPGARATELSS
jgi:heme exporter protein A